MIAIDCLVQFDSPVMREAELGKLLRMGFRRAFDVSWSVVVAAMILDGHDC